MKQSESELTAEFRNIVNELRMELPFKYWDKISKLNYLQIDLSYIEYKKGFENGINILKNI